MNYKDIPIFINSFNRPTFLMQQIYRLHSMGYDHIIIIDNGSTDPITQVFLKNCNYEVYAVGANKGYKVIWEENILEKYNYENDYYVYTDCDIIPSENCPEDFMLKFHIALNEYKDVDKVGFGLISSITDRYKRWKEVQEWEAKFWEKPIEETTPRLYRADIDTTFALYRPGIKTYSHKALRVGYPYVAIHLPWYENSERPFLELEYYRTQIFGDISFWNSGRNIEKGN